MPKKFLDKQDVSVTVVVDHCCSPMTEGDKADLFGIDFAARFIRKIGMDNVVFGSDWVGTNTERNAQLSVIEKMSLAREEKEKILGENIRKTLKA